MAESTKGQETGLAIFRNAAFSSIIALLYWVTTCTA